MQKLKYLKNSELDQKIKSLAQQERELLAEVLETIKEIANRRLYLEMGFASLFAYLTEHVGYSEGSAQRRIDAARVMQEIPEIKTKIESGEINLSQISILQKATREIIKRTGKDKLTNDKKLELIESIVNKNYAETQKQVAQFCDLPIQQNTQYKTQSDGSVRIEMTLTKDQFAKLQQAQGLISHSVPTNELTAFIQYVSEKIIKQKMGKPAQASNGEDKKLNTKDERKSTAATATITATVAAKARADLAGNNKSTATMAVENPHNSSTINSVKKQNFSAKIKKLTLQKFKHCQHVDTKSNKQCQSTWFLQIDHKQSKWANGDNAPQNASLLCGKHNREKYHHEQRVQRV